MRRAIPSISYYPLASPIARLFRKITSVSTSCHVTDGTNVDNEIVSPISWEGRGRHWSGHSKQPLGRVQSATNRATHKSSIRLVAARPPNCAGIPSVRPRFRELRLDPRFRPADAERAQRDPSTIIHMKKSSDSSPRFRGSRRIRGNDTQPRLRPKTQRSYGCQQGESN